MKKIMILMSALLAIVAFGSTKNGEETIINSSAKEVPTWLEHRSEGSIVVSAEALSLDQAHSKAEVELNRYILKKALPEDFSLSEEVVSMLPIMKEINETRPTESYWVKVENNSTHESCYRYSLCSSMSEKDLKLLNSQLYVMNKEKCDELKKISNQLNNVDSENQLKENIEKIDTLECYFGSKVKLSELKKLRTSYIDRYKELKPEVRKMKDGQYRLTFKLNDRPFKLTTMPIAMAEDRSFRVQVEPANGTFNLTCTPADNLDGKAVTLSLVLDKRRQSYTVNL